MASARVPTPSVLKPVAKGQNETSGPSALSSVLHAAEQKALSLGTKMTKIRRHVLIHLLEAGRPMSAYDLIETLDGVGAQKPPTIYRALAFLEKIGSVRKLESQRTYVALRNGPTSEPLVLTVCDDCGSVGEVEAASAFSELFAQAQQEGFTASLTTIELRGRCGQHPYTED